MASKKKRVRKENVGEVRNKQLKIMAVITCYLTVDANHIGKKCFPTILSSIFSNDLQEKKNQS